MMTKISESHSTLPIVLPGTIASATATLREFACPNWPHPGITGCEYCVRAEERGVFEALRKIMTEVEFQLGRSRDLLEQLEALQVERDDQANEFNLAVKRLIHLRQGIEALVDYLNRREAGSIEGSPIMIEISRKLNSLIAESFPAREQNEENQQLAAKLLEAERIFRVLKRTGPLVPVQEASAIEAWLR